MRERLEDRYEVRFVPPEYMPNGRNDNVDVEVVFSDGYFFSATFFTLENIHSIMKKNRGTGESAGGRYFFATDMIIVEELTVEHIKIAVEDLLNSGEFDSAFSGPYPVNL